MSICASCPLLSHSTLHLVVIHWNLPILINYIYIYTWSQSPSLHCLQSWSKATNPPSLKKLKTSAGRQRILKVQSFGNCQRVFKRRSCMSCLEGKEQMVMAALKLAHFDCSAELRPARQEHTKAATCSSENKPTKKGSHKLHHLYLCHLWNKLLPHNTTTIAQRHH